MAQVDISSLEARNKDGRRRLSEQSSGKAEDAAAARSEVTANAKQDGATEV